jgi:thiol-disulfide isomerase/thioredoxin
MDSAARRATSVALIVIAAAFARGDTSLAGKPAPEIQATDWIHGDGRTSLADFRGEVVLLEFWKSKCPASRAEVRHLVKLTEDYGRRGLAVIALTGDDDRRSLERFLTHADASPNYRIAIGGAGAYPVARLPCAVLVGADGDVIVDGTAGRTVSDKDVEAALKAAPALTAEQAEARAAKRLAFAEAFIADRLFVRAEYELSQVAKLGAASASASARRAQELLKSFGDGDAAAELAAQRDVAKLAGLNATLEHAADRVKSAEAESLAKRLAKKAEDLRAKTPRAAQLAADWAAIYAEPWR